ncbi:unnamed protein product [Nyctereutes procyonoides]|uniref:(raccoon dog) hypothetical protein n=1 Tax=Nyctereutes procyonoides TaxID=34880 RepID=A0A811ZIN8_NYCPR|nr:unnamed protein product [Nyctereutes procyonoides]
MGRSGGAIHNSQGRSLHMVNCGPEADDPPSDYHQEVSSHLVLHHNACVIHLTSSHHMGILSSHISPEKRKKMSTNILKLTKLYALNKYNIQPPLCSHVSPPRLPFPAPSLVSTLVCFPTSTSRSFPVWPSYLPTALTRPPGSGSSGEGSERFPIKH